MDSASGAADDDEVASGGAENGVAVLEPRAEDAGGLAEEFERYRRALSEPVLDFAALEAEAEERRVRHADPVAAPEPAT